MNTRITLFKIILHKCLNSTPPRIAILSWWRGLCVPGFNIIEFSVFIGIFEHSSINTFVLDDKAWLTVSSLAHIPKVFRLRSGNYAGQVGPSTPNLSSMSLWTWLCKLVYSRVGTGRGYPQLFHKALYTIELCCGLAGSVSASLLHRPIQLFWHLD